MPAVGLHDDTYDKLRLLARAWGITEGEVVSRLLTEFQRVDRRPGDAGQVDRGIALHAIYDGVQVTALFIPATQAVTVTSGGLAGQTFRSPSGAAVAVVGALNPSVKPNRSGWSFWTITENGQLLQSIRR